MKTLLTLTLTLLLTLPAMAFAEGGVYYNPLRDGEGITAFHRDGEYALWFYTYTDNGVSVPPFPSPAPPAPSIKECVNCPVWYVGYAADWENGLATGILYLALPLNYPEVGLTKDGTAGLADLVEVGAFIAVADDKGGFLMEVVKVGHELPDGATLYNTTFTFDRLLME